MKNPELHDDGEIVVRTDIQNRLRKWRRRLILQRLLNTMAAVAVLVAIGRLLATPLALVVQQILALGLVSFILLRISRRWRRLTPGNFLQHLNRRFPDLEESAQLLVHDKSKLAPLQLLQYERAESVYTQNIAQLERWLPPFRYKPAATVILLSLLAGLFSGQLAALHDLFLQKTPVDAVTYKSPLNTTVIDSPNVRIEPPAYTGLALIETDQLNLELPAGSRVEWSFSLDTHGDAYALQLSGDRQIALSPVDDRTLTGGDTIDSTDLYRITRNRGGDIQTIGEIHTLTVLPDRAPYIRILEPELTTLEIPKEGPASFTSRALVRDDYGLQNVDILASVAKGSGEGVKFRDEKLYFDQSLETENGFLYHKEWDLEALGMEPGDEVYFTVIATDNRLPTANTGRSATLTIRWLEDEQSGLAGDGLGIDFIPEFFKSQRQIIIDTEQLLEDEARLSTTDFKDTSYEIGQAQASLKEKHGQFLGDEFGEGAMAPAGQNQDDATHDEGGHHEGGHEQADSVDTKTNLNSTADIIRLFGHDHGDPEIGPITARNPVALMKRAVSEMWQAERHLLQAQPALALPFEYEAWKYLKLARQADRIYVKRLGFEPPPVSEERRLSGRRDEILSYEIPVPQQVFARAGEQFDQQGLKDAFLLLTQHSYGSSLDDDERDLLSRLSREFTRNSQQRPALIRHAASLEKLALAGRMELHDCEACVEDLKSTIWSVIDEDASQLRYRTTAWFADDGLIKSYQQLRGGADENVATTPAEGHR